jgi:hypothetical protein
MRANPRRSQDYPPSPGGGGGGGQVPAGHAPPEHTLGHPFASVHVVPSLAELSHMTPSVPLHTLVAAHWVFVAQELPFAGVSTVHPPHALAIGALHITPLMPLQTSVPKQPPVPVHNVPFAGESTVHPPHALAIGALHITPSMPLQTSVPVQPPVPVHDAPFAGESVMHPPHALSAVGALQLTAVLPLQT